MRKYMNALATAIMLMVHAAPAQAQIEAKQRIYVINNCKHTVKFFVRHATFDQTWENNGWWELAPDEKKLLAMYGVAITHLNNHKLYIYGYTPYASVFWRYGGVETRYGGRIYNMQEANEISDDEGDNVVTLTCDN